MFLTLRGKPLISLMTQVPIILMKTNASGIFYTIELQLHSSTHPTYYQTLFYY